MCVSLGEVLVRPLAEALSVEERPRTRERLTADPAGVRLGRPPDDRTAEELAEPGGAPDGDSPDAAVRRQRGAARSDRAARRQRAAGAARSGARDSQHRHRRGLPDSRAGARRRHRRGRATRSCSRSAWCATSARRRCSPTSSGTSITAARSRRSTCARSSRSARCAIPAGIAPLRDALYKGEWWAPRRTAALRAPPRPRRWRASARPTRSPCSTKRSPDGSRGVRAAARAQLVTCARARPARAAGRRRMSAPRFQLADELLRALRRVAALGAALLEGPSDHRAQPRVAVGRASAAARPAADGHHRPGRRRSDRRRHADGEGRHARPVRPPAAAGRRRAHHHRSRRHARGDHRRSSTAITTHRRAPAASAVATFPDDARTSASAASPVEQRVEGSLTDMATIKRLYNDAVSVGRRRVGQRADRGQARRRPSRAR